MYTRELQYDNLWISQLPLRGPSEKIEARQIPAGTSHYYCPAVSPDGKLIAFVRDNIFVRPIEGGQEQQLTFLDSQPWWPAWSPDGKEIAFLGRLKESIAKNTVWVVNANGGAPREFPRSEVDHIGIVLDQVSWAPGPRIVYSRPGHELSLLDPATGDEILLGKFGDISRSALQSPDGRRVIISAFNGRSRSSSTSSEKEGLWLISLQNSSQKLLNKETKIDPLYWSADRKWIYAAGPDPSGKRPELWMIDSDNSEIRRLGPMPEQYFSSRYDSMFPDGLRMLCTIRETKSDVWMVENFDPSVATAPRR